MRGMRFALAILVPALLLLSLLLSCAPAAAPSPTPTPAAPVPAATPRVAPATPAPQAAPPPTATPVPSRPAWQAEWESLIVAAKKEGVLRVHGGGVAPRARDGIIKATKDKFGIEVEMITGRGAAQSERILQERRAGIFYSDVYVGGGTTPTVHLKPNGALEPLDKTIFLPEAVDEKLWRGGLYHDKDHTIAAGFGSVQPLIFVNSQLIKPEEIRSLDDLLDPKWQGKIAINDPTTMGVGKSSMQTIYILKGEDFVKKLVGHKPSVLRDQRQQTEWVARGKLPVGIGGESTIVKEFLDAGAPLRWIVPTEGAFVTTGTGCVAMINRPAHPSAAKLFINWVLSKEGQTIWAKAADFASRRVDVSAEHLDAARRPQPEVKYITENEEFQLASDNYMKLFRDIFKPVM